MIDGRVDAGSNAVLSFKRGGYFKTDFDLQDFGSHDLFRILENASKYWKNV